MKIKGILSSFACLYALNAIGSEDKINFIIINCDDMGYGDLSCFGNPSIKTPNLDLLSLQGQKWTNFYVSSSVSSPSRAGLMTGRLGIRTGMYGNRNGVLFPNSPEGLPESEITIAELLKSVGYNTACIGKWHLGHTEKYLPLNHGFDYFYGFPFSNDMSKKEQSLLGNPDYPYEYILYEQNNILEKEPDQHYLTKKITSAAVKYIASHKESPFFLYLAHPMPHVPVYASDEFLGKSARGRYGDAVEEIDWSVGAIMDCLKNNGLKDNTLIVFTSDNGPWLIYEQEGGSSGPLKDGKGTHYEGGFRVPCIIWGNMVDSGHITEVGSTLDILPTFCDIAGIKLSKKVKLDGHSLLNVLKDKKEHSERKYFYYYIGNKLCAIRKGKYKLDLLSKSSSGLYKLFDLGVDPGERYDISEQNKEIVFELLNDANKFDCSVEKKESIFDKGILNWNE